LKRKNTVIVIVVCLLLVPVLFRQVRQARTPVEKIGARVPGGPGDHILPPSISLKDNYRTVVRAVDGDTLLLDGGERVRLIGVDTPETVHPSKPVERYGREASDFTKKMTQGKKVRLEYDWQRQDRYGRTLAYIYLPDGTLLNAEIIKQGYGHAYTRFPFKYIDEFRQYEREARESGAGLWAD